MNIKILTFFISIIVGFAFVLWPRTNIPYHGNPNLSSPDACQLKNYNPYTNEILNVIRFPAILYNYGLKEYGLPAINRSIYTGNCINRDNSISLAQAALDFVAGSAIGFTAGYGIYSLKKMRKL